MQQPAAEQGEENRPMLTTSAAATSMMTSLCRCGIRAGSAHDAWGDSSHNPLVVFEPVRPTYNY
jgi:hypothetical protein